MSCHPRELRKLRNFPVPESALEAGRKKLLEFMAETPMVPLGRRAPFLLRWRPWAVTLCVAVFVTSGAGVVAAAQHALPGDRLYPVKLAGEEFHERLAFSPARKFTIQAGHAARRLQETERLMQRNGLARQEHIARMHVALNAYEENLFNMNALALTLSVHPPKAEAGGRAFRAAEKVFDRHAALVASATVTRPIEAEAVLEPIDVSFDLQSDLLDALGSYDRSSDGESAPEQRYRQRAEEIQEQLKSLRFGLDAENSLEDQPKE